MMTVNQRFENIGDRIRTKKYVLINALSLVGLIAVFFLFLNRRTFDLMIGNHIEGMWLYHLGIFYPLYAVTIFTIMILFYGLVFDQDILDRKLKVYSASYWKSFFSELFQIRREILVGVLSVIGLLLAQGALTLSISLIFNLEFIGVMFYQVLITILAFNITPAYSFSFMRSVLFSKFNLASTLYFFVMIIMAIKMYT